MIAKSPFPHFLAVVFYALLITIFGRHFRLEFLFFWVGLLIGSLILYFDPLISAYFALSETPGVQKAKQAIKQKEYKEVFLLAFSHQQNLEQSILHSALFQFALTALSFYIVTSSGSIFGSGLVMGMTLHLIWDDVAGWRIPAQLNKMLFWNIHREISYREQKIFLGIIFALFSLETLILI